MRASASIVVRQAVTSTIVMLVAIALIALTARIVIERQQRDAMIATIDTDIAGLSDGMVRGGVAEVSARINDRIVLTTGGDAQYRLSNARGASIAGNLAADTTLDPARSQSGSIATGHGPALARATRLRGGYTLIVARSLRPVDAVVDRLMALFALASIPAALASLLAGAASARRLSLRVTVLNHVFGRFEAGEHSARSKLGAKNDELGRLSSYIDRHLAQTEELFSAQRQISENIAHELRTPLGHLDARLLHMISRITDPIVEEELHLARDDIRSIVSLFDALLDLALADAGDRGTNAGVFDLSEIIGDLAELYGPSAEEAGLEFTARITPSVTMRGEPMAMTRAVANLLDNAFKFSSAGSHVRLTITPGPRITVEDDGPGVPPDLRDSVFDRFRGSRDRGAGHGVGLALVKVIAVRHGLAPRFEDASPGARFILALASAA